jgi:histidinol-phosphate aminotransferase
MAEAFRPESLLRPEIQDLEEYVPIQPLDVLSQRLGIEIQQVVKLDANENPYGPVAAVAEALAEYPYYHIYPDPQQTELRSALSRHCAVPAENILPSHGADELLDYLCRMFLSPGDAVVDCPPTFGMYSFDAGLSGGSVVRVWRRQDYSVDVSAVEQAVCGSPVDPNGRVSSPKILFLASPNNPSGNWLPDDDLLRLLELPLLVVVDEAYVEFADYPSRAPWVLERDNLVVLRTFSKAAGLAGLRLGYGICPSWLMRQLWKFKQPYNVSVAASVAGLASLEHGDEICLVVGKIRAERTRLVDRLAEIEYLEPYPSQANFVLCHVVHRSAFDLKMNLETHGVLVRYYDKPGLQNCLRISVGRPDQSDRLLEVLHGLT